MHILKKGTFIRKFLWTLLGVFVFLVILASFLFTPVDREHWKEDRDFVENMELTLVSIKIPSLQNGRLKAGWAKVNILPAKPLPIASYGIRENYDSVHDTVWCRSFVFDNGYSKVVMITLDLLIFPPALVEKISPVLKNKGYSANNCYFSASHTHNGPGGWAENIGGRLLAGPYNAEYVDLLVNAIDLSVSLAEKNMEHASIGYTEYEASEFLMNRYSNDPKDVDDLLRVIKIKKHNGKIAIINSYAAHPTLLSSNINEVGGDYAGALVDSIESHPDVEFAAFFAGAVGAHVCSNYKGKNYQAIGQVAGSLNDKIIKGINDINLTDSVQLYSLRIPVYMMDPQLKVFPGWRIRPWVFQFLFGEQQVYLSVLKINETILVGTPCDFGGELVQNFSELVEEKKMKLMITSFNGAYVGYIVPDKYYDIDKRETRDMSWYGPYNAEFFTYLIKSILKKF